MTPSSTQVPSSRVDQSTVEGCVCSVNSHKWVRSTTEKTRCTPGPLGAQWTGLRLDSKVNKRLGGQVKGGQI